MKHKIRRILMEKKKKQIYIQQCKKKGVRSWSFHVLNAFQNYHWKENGSLPLSLLTMELEKRLTKYSYVESCVVRTLSKHKNKTKLWEVILEKSSD